MGIFSIFGSSEPVKKEPTTLEAIAKLKETAELLEKKSNFIETKVHEMIILFRS